MPSNPEAEISEEERNAYKVPPVTVCWWCETSGKLTEEHKFKKSDLKILQESGDLTWGDGTHSKPVVNISKAKIVRFRKSLCAKCNGARSQPFDFAYEQFSNFVLPKMDNLWKTTKLNLSDVYGKNWKDQSTDLARYVIKHAGCRMNHEGYPIPPSFRAFLSGETPLGDAHIVLIRHSSIVNKFQQELENGIEVQGCFMDPAGGELKPSTKRMVSYWSTLTVGYFGFYYYWSEDDENFAQYKSFYEFERPPVYYHPDQTCSVWFPPSF